MNQDQLTDDRNTLIARLFTLGGSVFFLIGSLLAAILAYQTYQKNLSKET